MTVGIGDAFRSFFFSVGYTKNIESREPSMQKKIVFAN